MPKKIQQVTKAHLVSVPLPNHGASYTVISHQFVIDYAYQALANAGFGIVDEQYRCTADGQIATGIYRLQFNNDPELSMMFAWTNSYNKQVKFQCVIGAHINTTGAVMISGNIGSWVRKHTGTADTETKEIIDNYISNAYMYYNQLVADKAAMEQVTLNIRRQSQLLGVLFAEYEILTTEQASIVRSQMSRPSVSFNNQESLWAFYNYVTIALQSSHPKTWLEDQRILHYFISTICDFSKPISQPVPAVSEPVEEEVVDPLYEIPNQTNILDQIAEVTEEEALSITLDETIEYTDPQGNTFEAPVVVENFVEKLEQEMVKQAEETNQVIEDLIWGTVSHVPSLEPTPEDHIAYEKEQEENPFAEEDNFELKEDLSIFELDEPEKFTLLSEEEKQESFNWNLEESDDDSEGPDFF
jgi:hypothetical protein